MEHLHRSHTATYEGTELLADNELGFDAENGDSIEDIHSTVVVDENDLIHSFTLQGEAIDDGAL